MSEAIEFCIEPDEKTKTVTISMKCGGTISIRKGSITELRRFAYSGFDELMKIAAPLVRPDDVERSKQAVLGFLAQVEEAFKTLN